MASDTTVAVGPNGAYDYKKILVDEDGHPQVDILSMPAVTATVSGPVDTELTTADLDTGAGTDTRAVVGIALAASGGALLVGSANPMPVSGTVAATQSGTWTEANSAAIAASLSVMDDWDESDRAKVNLIAGQAGVQGDSGAVNALTQRVVLATDVALPAATNAIGKLAANNGVDIGDVTVNNKLVVVSYDYIALTYVAAGNGAGEIETVVYKTGGSGGTTVTTLTLGYNSDHKLTSVTRT